MRLISMTDFVLGTESNLDKHNPIGMVDDIQKRYVSIIKYANFLKQPLKLGMFVPCDEDGNVLVEFDDRYEESKERVLFEGFEIIRGEEPSQFTLFLCYNNESVGFKKDWKDNFEFDYMCIESLVHMDNNLTINPSALKQIGL